MTTECGCIPCPLEGTHIRGQILDYSTRNPIASAIITASGFEEGRTSTDTTGNFFMVLSDIEDKRYVQITANHASYTELPRMISLGRPGQTHYEIMQMFKKEEPIRIESSEDSNIPINQGSASRKKRSAIQENRNLEQHTFNTSVFIPGNSFLRLNGSEYDGSVNASITSIDTSDFGAMMNTPAEMNYIDSDGEYRPLRGYALFTFSFIDAIDGDDLQLRNNISLTMKMPYQLKESALLFMYNDQTSTWNRDIQLNKSVVHPQVTEMSGSFFISYDIAWLMVASEIPVEDICYSKIKVYETNTYERVLEEEANIKIIVNDQPSVKGPNYGEISTLRAISDSGNVEGYCIAHSCQKTVAIENHLRGFFTAESGSSSNFAFLYPSLNHEGITDKTATLIEYDTDTISDVPLTSALLNYNIISNDLIGPYYDQHEYDWQRSDTCSLLQGDHFRFYQSNATHDDESCIKESKFTVQEDVQEGVSPTESHTNNLAWFGRSARSLYDACYIKLAVSSSKPVTIRALSKGGNISHGADIVAGESLFGFRDKCQLSAMCLEVKHPGKVATGQVDNTRIEVMHLPATDTDVSCRVSAIKQEMITVYSEYVLTSVGEPEFHMYLKNAPFGPTFGIYCVKSEDDKETARNKAKAMCYRGDYDDSLTLPEIENDENWCVRFSCN